MFSIPIFQPRRRRRLAPAFFLLSAALLGACDDPVGEDSRAGTFFADAVRLGGGTARTFVTLDERGTPASIGVELTESALTALPDTMLMLHLPFPSQAPQQYTFLMLDWNPHGHEPEQVYTVPHFDFHFYMAPEAQVKAIPGGPDPVVPEARFIPAGYISPGNMAVPGMGVHWVDSAAGELNGRPFDQTMLYGFTQGRMIFVEPMITKAFLEARPNFSAPVKLPQQFQQPGLYPHRYSIRHDAAARVYRITMDELTAH